MKEDTIQEMAAKASDALDKEMAFKAKVEILAQRLYKTFCTPEEYKQLSGVDGPEKPAWYIEGLPASHAHLSLAEWQRDDYRAQATRLLQDPDYIKEQAMVLASGCVVGWNYALDEDNKLKDDESSVDGALKQCPYDPDIWMKL